MAGDLQSILTDPDFLASSAETKRQILSANDQDFAASSQQTQNEILARYGTQVAPAGTHMPYTRSSEALLTPDQDTAPETPIPNAPIDWATAGSIAGSGLGSIAARGAAPSLRAAASIFGGIVGGEAGGQYEGAPRGSGALVGGFGAALGEALGPLGSWLARSTGGAKTRIAHGDASEVIDYVRRQSTGLGRAEMQGVTPSEQLRSIATGAGRRAIGAEKEEVISGIESALRGASGTADIYVPSLSKPTYGPSLTAPAMDATGTAIPSKVSLRAANEELTAIGEGLRHMDIGDRKLREQLIQRDYKALANEIRRGLDEIAPGMGAVWQVGQENARAGYALVKELRNPAAWRPGNNGLELNTAYLQQRLLNPKAEETLRWRLKEGGLDEYADTITRGAGLGHVDINASGRGGMGQSFGQLARSPSSGSGSVWQGPLRAILPNLGAKYVGAPGRVPYAIDPGTQALLDFLGIGLLDKVREQGGISIGPTYGR